MRVPGSGRARRTGTHPTSTPPRRPSSAPFASSISRPAHPASATATTTERHCRRDSSLGPYLCRRLHRTLHIAAASAARRPARRRLVFRWSPDAYDGAGPAVVEQCRRGWVGSRRIAAGCDRNRVASWSGVARCAAEPRIAAGHVCDGFRWCDCTRRLHPHSRERSRRQSTCKRRSPLACQIALLRRNGC